MACNTISAATTSVAGVTAYAPLSSASSPFVVSSAPPMLAPLSSASTSKSLSVSCSLSEKDAPAHISMGKALLTGFVAAGAALSVFTADTASPPAAFAASGPGSSGAERTAQKAQDLLRAADKLNVEDAPQRFGPGRVTGGNTDAGKVAQDAGGKAVSQIQDGISSIAGTFSGKKGEVENAASNVASQAQSKVDEATGNSGPGGLFSSLSGKKGDVQNAASNVASQAQSKVDEATGNSGPGGLFSSLSGKKGDVQNAASNVANQAQNKVDEATGNSGPGGVLSSLSGKKGDVENAASNVANQAQNKVDEATGNSGPGGLFSALNNTLKGTVDGIKDNVEQKDAEAKRTLDEASSNVQNKLQ